MNPTRDLLRGISCPAHYYRGLCRLRNDVGFPIGQLPGKAVGNSYTLPLGLRRISFSQCLFQVGRSQEPDTSLRWDRQARWPRKHTVTKFFADFTEFHLLPRTDGTQLSSAGLPHRSLGAPFP